MKGKYFIIKLGIYPFDVMVSVDETDDVLVERMITRFGNTKEACGGMINMPPRVIGRTSMLWPTNHTVIRLKTGGCKNELAGCIAHEVFHATTFIMRRVGMKLKLDVSDEAYAYLIGFLTKEIHTKLKLYK